MRIGFFWGGVEAEQPRENINAQATGGWADLSQLEALARIAGGWMLEAVLEYRKLQWDAEAVLSREGATILNWGIVSQDAQLSASHKRPPPDLATNHRIRAPGTFISSR